MDQIEIPSNLQKTSRKRSPREVLDLHADLHRQLSRPSEWMKRCMRDYALRDIDGHPEWAASHLHPARHLGDLDPWLESLGSDLAGATTYQVTAEMVELAEGLRVNTPDLEDIRAEDLPSDCGFMWLDKPVPRPSLEDDEDHPPLMMHAVSWTRVPDMGVRVTDGKKTTTGTVAAMRVREWGFNDDPDIRPGPLHLMGQTTVPLTERIITTKTELWFVHMVWILMGMEITSVREALPDRHTAKRAKALDSTTISVVTLRRPARTSSKPPASPKHIDWSCTWLVRGHHRKAPHGGTFADGRETTWVRPHIKGPDGAPLRSADILYKLAR